MKEFYSLWTSVVFNSVGHQHAKQGLQFPAAFLGRHPPVSAQKQHLCQVLASPIFPPFTPSVCLSSMFFFFYKFLLISPPSRLTLTF